MSNMIPPRVGRKKSSGTFEIAVTVRVVFGTFVKPKGINSEPITSSSEDLKVTNPVSRIRILEKSQVSQSLSRALTIGFGVEEFESVEEDGFKGRFEGPSWVELEVDVLLELSSPDTDTERLTKITLMDFLLKERLLLTKGTKLVCVDENKLDWLPIGALAVGLLLVGIGAGIWED